MAINWIVFTPLNNDPAEHFRWIHGKYPIFSFDVPCRYKLHRSRAQENWMKIFYSSMYSVQVARPGHEFFFFSSWINDLHVKNTFSCSSFQWNWSLYRFSMLNGFGWTELSPVSHSIYLFIMEFLLFFPIGEYPNNKMFFAFRGPFPETQESFKRWRHNSNAPWRSAQFPFPQDCFPFKKHLAMVCSITSLKGQPWVGKIRNWLYSWWLT